ncbi:MAG TPA: DUF2330 domain-containing protein [Bacteroidia bacterium]|nr:DUF2330 domain-containing protein [Bacteroidia bacterium]
MKSRMLKILLPLCLLLGWAQQAAAFCGFYVAKADATLFNKSSQVIIVRDGDRTVITMSSDYQGDAKDFAMVVPVPEVLMESDIRVVEQYVFEKFDAYTAPRLVEYWDPNPCIRRYHDMMKGAERAATKSEGSARSEAQAKALGVTIEAKYTVGEYDILILSALESSGLKTWLTDNGYKIPKGADEVLDPYIKDGMKFFVVKVNLEQQKALGVQTLRPLQIQFQSSRFMLPIRLGMANATAAQDMIVYAFTRRGHVETTNYRTTPLPTNRDIPEFIQTDGLFGAFYKAVFERAWAREGKNTVMLEYAWDVSSQRSMKCDPCVTQPITFAELRQAGIWWVEPGQNGGYVGDLFVTRLHVRYARKTFPQDLMFLNTSDQGNFQGRYVVRHAPKEKMDCPEGKAYQASLQARRQKELAELAALTGWKTDKWASYVNAAAIAPTPANPFRKAALPNGGDPLPLDTVAAMRMASLDTIRTLPPDSGEMAAAMATATAESIAASEEFLKPATESPRPFLSTKAWLFILAAAMFVAGILVRLWGRKRNAEK